MKLFYKKDYKRVLVDYEVLSKEYRDVIEQNICETQRLADIILKLQRKNELAEIEIKNRKTMNEMITTENDNLKKKIQELQGAKGGYIKQINKLKKELEESLSDKYLKRTIKPSKVSKQTMALKSSSVQSRIAKLVKEQ